MPGSGSGTHRLCPAPRGTLHPLCKMEGGQCGGKARGWEGRAPPVLPDLASWEPPNLPLRRPRRQEQYLEAQLVGGSDSSHQEPPKRLSRLGRWRRLHPHPILCAISVGSVGGRQGCTPGAGGVEAAGTRDASLWRRKGGPSRPATQSCRDPQESANAHFQALPRPGRKPRTCEGSHPPL